MSTLRDDRTKPVGPHLLGLLVLLLVAVSPRVSIADPFVPSFQELAPGVWAGIRDDSPRFPVMGTCVFVVGDDGVVVFDGGGIPLMSERILAKIKEVTDLPVTHVIISHWHGDHNLGIYRILVEFPAAVVIGHAFTRAAMLGSPMDYAHSMADNIDGYIEGATKVVETGAEPDGEPLSDEILARYQLFLDHSEVIRTEYQRVRVTPPTITFEDKMFLHLGNRVIELRYLGNANTAGDIVMWLPAERIVATGDMVVAPTPYGFNVPPRVWVETLRQLKALDFEVLVPGHGEIQGDTDYVDLLMATAESIADQRDSLLATGMENEEVETQLDFSAWRERYTGGDPILENRWQSWFEGPFRKAVLKALKDEPMVVVGPSADEDE